MLNRTNSRVNDRGAVAVEAALVIPILVLLVMGIIEMSLLLRDHSVVTSNTRTGARIASTGAGAGPATCESGAEAPPCSPGTVPALAQLAADAVQRSGSAMPPDYVDYIIVYEANADGYPGGLTELPNDDAAPCGGAVNCVVYEWRPDADRFLYRSGSWPSAGINACFPGSPSSPLDRVGVALQASHPMVTGMFGATFELRDHAVMNFEPLPAGICAAGRHT